MQYPPDEHLSPEHLEEFSLGKLSPTRTAAVEEHLLICQACRETLCSIEPYNFIHHTRDGPIYSRVTRLRSGMFAARHWGRWLNGGKEFNSRQGAKAYLVRTFGQMFPEHVCTKSCGPACPPGPAMPPRRKS